MEFVIGYLVIGFMFGVNTCLILQYLYDKTRKKPTRVIEFERHY